MILVDTSAWVEYLRATGSAIHVTVRDLLAREAPLATTDVVVMEVLAGARTDAERDRLRRLLYSRCTFIPIEGPADYEEAAELYRVCRRGGATIRKLTDCLIAAVAIRADAELLHHDGDFDAIARHNRLRIARS